MSLLSQTESMAFQSFLTSVEGFHGPTPAEWLLYTQGTSDSNNLDLPKSKDAALTKATLDLMSLDTPASSSKPPPSSWPNFRPNDPASVTKSEFRYPMGREPQSETTSPPPYPANTARQFLRHTSSSSNSPSPGPFSSSLPDPSSSQEPPSKSNSSSKRSHDNVVPTSKSSRKRPRTSPSSRQESETQSNGELTPPPSLSSRPTLLSASQKRANHIQSEQKRRANIRKGYEALCETIPALREAIRKEEGEAAANSQSGGSTPASLNNTGKGGRRKKGKIGNDYDKIDGRAGPKSENVVLQKTIDYIQELNLTRDSLLHRLQHAKSSLSPNHPALSLLHNGGKMWEREWNGGFGSADDDDDDGVSDDDVQE